MVRHPLKIHFGGQANLFVSGRHQIKDALNLVKAGLSFLEEHSPDTSRLLAVKKQLLELRSFFKTGRFKIRKTDI